MLADALRLALAVFESLAVKLLFADAFKLAAKVAASVEPVVFVPDELVVELDPEPPEAAERL